MKNVAFELVNREFALGVIVGYWNTKPTQAEYTEAGEVWFQNFTNEYGFSTARSLLNNIAGVRSVQHDDVYVLIIDYISNDGVVVNNTSDWMKPLNVVLSEIISERKALHYNISSDGDRGDLVQRKNAYHTMMTVHPDDVMVMLSKSESFFDRAYYAAAMECSTPTQWCIPDANRIFKIYGLIRDRAMTRISG